jgi:hypothetical protein
MVPKFAWKKAKLRTLIHDRFSNWRIVWLLRLRNWDCTCPIINPAIIAVRQANGRRNSYSYTISRDMTRADCCKLRRKRIINLSCSASTLLLLARVVSCSRWYSTCAITPEFLSNQSDIAYSSRTRAKRMSCHICRRLQPFVLSAA